MEVGPSFCSLNQAMGKQSGGKKTPLSLWGDFPFGCAEGDRRQALSAAACVSWPKLPLSWLLISCLEAFPAQRQTTPYHVVHFIPTSKYVSVLVESVFPQNFHSDRRERAHSHHNAHSH